MRCCALVQVIANLTASLMARGIDVVTSEGTPQHIDFLKVTSTGSLDAATAAASKAYLDWYMLRRRAQQPAEP